MSSNVASSVGGAPVKKTKTHYKFGEKALSDVTLIVGEKEFSCHKMVLAARSSYFKALFYSEFKEKDQNKVSIVADPVAFAQLIQLVYTKRYHDWVLHRDCTTKTRCELCVENSRIRGSCGDCMPISSVWKHYTSLLKLADQFDLLEYTINILEGLFLRGYCRCGMGADCIRSAVKLVIAVVYGMNIFKGRCEPSKAAVAAVLTEIEKEGSTHRIFSASDILWLLERKEVVKTTEDTNSVSISEAERTVYTYGDPSLSDVTVVVGEKEFNCHKMVLAALSSYFKTMFFSDSKEKEKDRVNIDADPIVFDQLMQLLYSGRYSTWLWSAYCNTKINCESCAPEEKDFGSCNECMPIPAVWKHYTALLKLADQFELLKYTKSAIERFFLQSHCKCGAERNCARSAVKLLIAVVNGMAVFKSRTKSTKASVVAALKEVEKVESVDRLFKIGDLLWLMERE